MKQIEFEEKLRELKRQKAEAIRPINDMQLECKKEQSMVKQQLSSLYKQNSRLRAEGASLHAMRTETERRWGDKILAFFDENYSTCERQLSDVSDWAIVNELLARGFTGALINDELDEQYMADLNRKLSGIHEQEQG